MILALETAGRADVVNIYIIFSVEIDLFISLVVNDFIDILVKLHCGPVSVNI